MGMGGGRVRGCDEGPLFLFGLKRGIMRRCGGRAVNMAYLELRR